MTGQPLIGFGGGFVYPLGFVKLVVRLGERGKGRSLLFDFLVVDTPLPYNAIMGRPTHHEQDKSSHLDITIFNYSRSTKQMKDKSRKSMETNKHPESVIQIFSNQSLRRTPEIEKEGRPYGHPHWSQGLPF